MTARQAEFAGAPEHARQARKWVASQVGHPDAELLTAELYAAVLSTDPERVLMTVTDRDIRVRITAYGSRPVPLGSLTDLGGRIFLDARRPPRHRP